MMSFCLLLFGCWLLFVVCCLLFVVCCFLVVTPRACECDCACVCVCVGVFCGCGCVGVVHFFCLCLLLELLFVLVFGVVAVVWVCLLLCVIQMYTHILCNTPRDLPRHPQIDSKIPIVSATIPWGCS